MRDYETYEYRVATHYAAAIFNGDVSGLEELDASALDLFMSDIPANSTLEWKDEGEWFTQDEVSGLMADCGTLLAHVFDDRSTEHG